MNTFELHHGDCLAVLRGLPSDSIDAIVTDPPYGLTTNKKGGTGVASVNLDSPYGRARIGTGNGAGGFMGLKWDADVPSVDVWAECLRVLKPGGHLLAFAGTRTQHRMAVRIEDAGFEIRDMIAWVYGSGFPKSHNGPWGGTALKPALEPITVARKPLAGTVAENVLRHGTGALNIDGCRVSMPEGEENPSIARYASTQQQGNNGWGHVNRGARFDESAAESASLGRWPANLIHDGSEEVVEPLGSAARFFYCAKASKADRGADNAHPTVKPTDLMRYLCRLVTPPGGVVLDPFTGSGSTGKAAILEGFRFVGIEREAEYVEIARARIQAVAPVAAPVAPQEPQMAFQL